MYSATCIWREMGSCEATKVCSNSFGDVQYNIEDRGSTVVKVLCYKSEGRCFDPSL